MKVSKIRKIHWSHVVAVVLLFGYFGLSKLMLVRAVSFENIVYSFLTLYLYGSFFGTILLYILSHKKFFSIGQEIEKEESKKERNLLKRYAHHGKVLSTLIIGTIGGPVFAALTARILLNNFRYKYFVILLANIFATFITLGAATGLLKFINI